MQTWTVPASTGCVVGHDAAPPSVADCLSQAIDAIGEPDFASQALSSINEALAVDFWSVYCLYGNKEPRMFLSGSLGPHDVSRDCFNRYQRGLYRRDRTLSAASDLAHTTSQPAMTLWNEAEIPSPHRDEIYRRHDILERLSVVSGNDSQGTLAMNFYRFRSSGGFRAHEVDAAQVLARLLLSCVKKQLQVSRICRAVRPVTDPKSLLLQNCPQLTARELDVCIRLLRGWTYEGIAQDLGLSVASIKTYRARAFDRLGIHFRNQLFEVVTNGSSNGPMNS